MQRGGGSKRDAELIKSHDGKQLTLIVSDVLVLPVAGDRQTKQIPIDPVLFSALRDWRFALITRNQLESWRKNSRERRERMENATV